MRYSEGSLRLLHDDLYQARYCYQMVNEEGRVIKKQVARNFHAASQKEAVLEKARIRDQLEREALIEDMLPCQKKNPKLSKFMFEQIDGMLKSGLIEPTTGAKYKSEANLILRFIDDVPVHKVTAAMVRKMDQDMLAKGYARETVARAHNALKRYLYEALEKGLIIAVPITRTVKPPRVERKDPNALDDETRKRLMSILDEMPDDQITLAIRLGLGAGQERGGHRAQMGKRRPGYRHDQDPQRHIVRRRKSDREGAQDRGWQEGHTHRPHPGREAQDKSKRGLRGGETLRPAGFLRGGRQGWNLPAPGRSHPLLQKARQGA